MDNIELHYLTYDPEEMWREMLLAYMRAGGDNLYPGDEKEMLLRGVQYILALSFAGVDNALRMATLRYAVRRYLDVIGENRFCTRIPAKAARATVTIYTNATGESGTLPAGTAMTSDGSMFYRTTEDIELSGAAQEITAEIVAEKAGIAGNGLPAGAQLGLSTTHIGIANIVATTDASGGQDEETDEAYRERIRTFGLASVTTGPVEQYRSVAMSVSSRILDAAPINGGGGVVNVYLLADGEEGTEGLISAVEEALNPDDVRPLNDLVQVQMATARPYVLNVGYSAWSGNNVAGRVAEAVEAYREWQETTIGQAFNPEYLMSLLYQAGCTRVIFEEGSEFDGGEAEYTEIEANEYCSGEINVEAIST